MCECANVRMCECGVGYCNCLKYVDLQKGQKYDKNKELDGNHIGGKNGIDAIPFELVIPQGVNQSYIGKYSEYFWGLEAKVNIAWSSDLIAKTIIEIV